jgi:hypothetical protein
MLLIFGVVGSARAQLVPTVVSAPPAPGSWQFSLTPYGWLPGLTGHLNTPLPRIGDRTASMSSGNVVSDLNAIPVMLAGEARYSRFIFVGDFFYAALRSNIDTPRDTLFQDGHARLTATIGTALGMVRVVEVPRQNFDAGFGVRAYGIGTKISLNPGLLPGVIQKTSVSWADPILAARYSVQLSPQFGLSAYGDVGGFGFSSKLTWQAIAAVDYQATDKITARLGWRYLTFDKTRGSFGLDVGFNGPFLSGTYRF